MPRKSAFYFFMLDFKEQQKLKGIQYANMAEIAQAAGPAWKDAPPSVRSKFDAIAKKEKGNIGPLQKNTCTGISLAEIARQERALQEAEENERRDIKQLVASKTYNNAIIREDFFVMDVNVLCKSGSYHVIGEFGLVRCNVRDGVKEHQHEIINPGRIPTGYASDVKYSCREFGLEMPDEDPEKWSNYPSILKRVTDFLKRRNQEDMPATAPRDTKTLPPIFTMPDKVAAVSDFILQMCERSGRSVVVEDSFRVYKLDTLLFEMNNAMARMRDERLPRPTLAFAHLKRELFQYTPGIGCEHHHKVDRTAQCSKSRAVRWAFSVLDRLVPLGGVEPVPGRHLPMDCDIEDIFQYKEDRRFRAGPSIAIPSDSSFSESSQYYTANDTFNTSSFNDSSLNYSTASTSRGLDCSFKNMNIKN